MHKKIKEQKCQTYQLHYSLQNTLLLELPYCHTAITALQFNMKGLFPALLPPPTLATLYYPALPSS